LASSTYELGAPSSATLTIKDNDFRIAGGLVGTSKLNPVNQQLPANGKVTYELGWTHPGVWRDLDTIEFRIVDDRDVAKGGVLAWVRWEESTNTLSLL